MSGSEVHRERFSADDDRLQAVDVRRGCDYYYSTQTLSFKLRARASRASANLLVSAFRVEPHAALQEMVENGKLVVSTPTSAPRNEIIQPPPHARLRPKLTTLCVNAIESKILLLFRFFMFFLEMAGVSHTHRLCSRSTDILSNESGFVCFFCYAYSPPRFSLSRLEASEQQANCRKRFLVV